ncbi:MAG: NAD-dependent epimerase/dehydratase family protein [Bdellovibrionota bacterium]
MAKSMFILGSTGFIGTEVVREALDSGWTVTALVRSQEAFNRLRNLGAKPILGDADNITAWVSEVEGQDVLIDLIQPKIPKRLTNSSIEKISLERQLLTNKITAALRKLKSCPLFISVSGVDDLEADRQGRISSSSLVKREPSGFAHIGIPVRRIVEASGVPAAFVYLGTVYGPGKTFAEIIVPRLAQGKWKIVGKGANRTPLVHVEDVARGLVHLAGLGPTHTVGKTFVLADAAGTTAKELFTHTAQLMGAKTPGHVPAWLASLVAGEILVETMIRDLVADPSGLLATGFHFKYPSHREGMPPTLKELGHLSLAKSVAREEKKGLPFWSIFLATFGFIATENLATFKLSVPYMLKVAGGLPILDMRLWYTPQDVYRLFEVMDAPGRTAYLQLFATVDIIIPALLGLFLWSAVSRGAFRKWRGIALVGSGFDFLENTAILVLLINYPAHLDVVAWIAACFTLLKHVSYVSTMGFAIVGYLAQVRHGSVRAFMPASSQNHEIDLGLR